MQVNELQKEILSNMEFDTSSKDIKVEIPELVFYLTSIHTDVAELALGKIGHNLIEFVNKIDFKHPDVLYTFNQIFKNDLILMQQVQELLELVNRYKHLSISNNFYKLIDHSKLPKTCLHSGFAARLFKSSKERDLVRKQKKTQIIDLKNICNKGIDLNNLAANPLCKHVLGSLL